MCVPKSIHRSDVMSLTEVFTYDDSAHDYFEREPYCAKLHIFDAGLFHWFIILGKCASISEPLTLNIYYLL